MPDNIFEDLEKRLPVMEVFLSIQGEGYHTGTASYFIRIGGCDVGCHWCDVKESWDKNKHPLLEVEKVVNEIPQNIKTVILTGGEPTLYNLNTLINMLKKRKMEIHLETAGIGMLPKNIDWICLSPKKNDPPKDIFYKNADELKIIVFNKSDFIFAEEQAKKINTKTKLYLQPEWSKRDKTIPLIIDYVKNNPKWKISLQTHKYINIP